MGQRVIPAEILGVEHLKNIELMPRIEQRPRVERESAEPSKHVSVGADLELRLIRIKKPLKTWISGSPPAPVGITRTVKLDSSAPSSVSV